MGIEWSLGEVTKQTISVPLTTMEDYYRSKGFKVMEVRLGHKFIGQFPAHMEETDPTFYDRHPNAQRLGRVNGKGDLFNYVDNDTVDHLDVILEHIDEGTDKIRMRVGINEQEE